MKQTVPRRASAMSLLVDGVLAIAALLGLCKPVRFSLRRVRR